MRIADFRITRFQYKRDRVIGDCQVKIAEAHSAALELIADDGTVGLGFLGSLFHPLASADELRRSFLEEVWPGLEGQRPAALVHKVTRPRGGNRRAFTMPFGEALQHALWDLFAKQLDLPLSKLLGATRNHVRAYASGLDYHLTDEQFSAFFGYADSIGYSAFKIKVGNKDVEWDLNRLRLLKKAVRKDAVVMADSNEAWSPKEAVMRLETYRQAGHDLLWMEDPIPRDDFAGLKMLRDAVPYTQINSGEYLDVLGKMALLDAEGADMLNVHGQVTDVMRIGWVAAVRNVPVTLGNTFLELGVNMATALPEVEWLEYSFQNYDHLVEQPMEIRDGYIYAPDRPGHGLVLSAAARTEYSRPDVLGSDQLGPAPVNKRLPIAL